MENLVMSDAYLDLRYNEVSFKASHNSYQRDEPFLDQIAFDPDKPYQAGCRGLELDISQSNDGLYWSVGHKSSYDKDYRQLSQFLGELRQYLEHHTDPDPVTLYLDLKHVATTQFPQQLDQYVLDYLGDGTRAPLYSPGQLMGTEPSLPEGARKNGWPTLRELRGKYLICLTGDTDAKEKYAATDPKNRLCFADKDEGASDPPASEDRVFFNYHLYSSDSEKWEKVFTDAKLRKDAITRGYVLNGESIWNKALNSGCHALATDKIKGHTWAKVGDEPFVKLKPLSGA
jgi:hypothetical protein